MRIQLAAAVALAPLMMASGAAAQVVISNERTTPVTTATANNGAPDSIRLANGGVIRLSSGVGITINSSHSVTIDNGGRIIFENAADGATGVLIEGGNTANLTHTGQITITDNFEGTDTDNDGDLDGAFATGTGRYGVRVTGPGVLTGDIIGATGSLINVEGNQSAAISVETGLIGNLHSFGSVSIVGTDTYGIRATGPITGDVYVGGTLSARGQNARGVSLEGDVDGRVIFGGSVTVTGFRYTGNLTAAQIGLLDADDLLVGGPAVSITGNVTGGVLFRGAIVNDPDDTDDDDDGILDTEDTDDDGNGIADASEAVTAIVSYGSAPAVQIGSTTQTVTLGLVGAGDDAYGLINRGGVTSDGVFEGFTSTALQLGVDGGMAVTIAGGLRNDGSFTAFSQNADATAVLFGSSADVGRLLNTGGIIAATAGDGTYDTVGVDIEAGAVLTELTNRGFIRAFISGEAGNATAIRDASGGLTSITNTGLIEATLSPTDDDDDADDDNDDAGDEAITGRAVAIDVRANTTGVTLVQDGVDDGDDGDDGFDDADADNDGVDDADEPAIRGDVLFGSGDDTFDVRNGEVEGTIEFGDGVDTLNIQGGAAVRGVLTDTDGLLDITVSNGVLDARQATALTASNLTVGADGDLIVTIDGAANQAGGFIITDTADIADGAGLGVRLTSLIQGNSSQFTIIQATNLVINGQGFDRARLEQNSPYMYVYALDDTSNPNQVYVTVSQRSHGDFGFISAESAAYGAFYEALSGDAELMEAFLSQTDRDGFFNLYEQMLPDHSGGPLMSLATGVDSVTRALSGRGYPASDGETSAWLQEINFYADKDKGAAYGFRSEGFGLAGGIERGTGLGAIGVSFALTSSDLEDPEAEAEEILSAQLLEFGLYWRAQGVRWNVWARGAAGYASFDSVRQFVATGISRRNESDWTGFSLAAAAGAAYNYEVGRWSIRPEAFLEYFSLSEEAHEETGGGPGFDLSIGDRDGHILSTTLAVTIGAGFGENRWLRPEVRFGWRQILSHNPGDTLATFSAGGSPFTLMGDSLEGGGPIVGFRLNLGNELGFLALEADAEMIDDYIRYALLLRASFKF